MVIGHKWTLTEPQLIDIPTQTEFTQEKEKYCISYFSSSTMLVLFLWCFTEITLWKDAMKGWNIGLADVEFCELCWGLPGSGIFVATTFTRSQQRRAGGDQHWCYMAFCSYSNLNSLSPLKKPQPQVEHSYFHPSASWYLVATKA